MKKQLLAHIHRTSFLVILISSSPLFAQEPVVINSILFDSTILIINEDSATVIDEPSDIAIANNPLPNPQQLSQNIILSDDIPIPIKENTNQSYEQNIEQYTEQVSSLASKGSYNSEISEPLLALADLHKSMGNYDEALEAYNQAFHINRINNGLFHQDQLSIIKSITNLHLENRALRKAHEQQEYLFYLQQKLHANNPEAMEQASLDFAEWNFSLAKLGYNYNLTGSFEFLLMRLIDAHNSYSYILENLENLSREQEPGFELALEERRASANYYFARYLSVLSNTPMAVTSSGLNIQSSALSEEFNNSTYSYQLNSIGFRAGRNALNNRLSYLESLEPTDVEQQVLATIDLADWHLLFQRRNSAKNYYETAMQILSSSTLTNKDELMKDLFMPEQPIQIPSYIPSANSRESLGIDAEVAINYSGYIDLTFQVSRTGNPSRINILGTSLTGNPPTRILRSNLEHAIFRPRFEEGNALPRETFTQRFYYALVENDISQ